VASAIGSGIPAPMDAAAFMREALVEGRKAFPACLPNPPVGCVLVRGDEIVARAHTQPPGRDHAEAKVLRQVDGDLSDVVMYVSLEPCSFRGRTPSCALETLRRGIRKVIVAILDPDPRNNGEGIRILRDAGVDVEVGLLAGGAQEQLGSHLALPANRNPASSENG
jgi:pyrimidine deaminase RibD-like protein